MKLLSLFAFFALVTVLVASKIATEGDQDMLERELSEIVDEGDQYIERELNEIADEGDQYIERELIEISDEGDQDVERELRFWQGGGARGFGGGRGGGGHRGGGHRGGGHRGGGGHGGFRGSGIGNVTLTCDSNCISCDIPYGRGLVIQDGGYRLCRQSRRDEKWYNLCLAKTEPMVGFVTDKWGCCKEDGTDKSCPQACSGCDCTETIGHFSSITVPGSTMNITRTHWYGGTTSFTKCVSNSFTVQKQLEGATCCP